MIGSYLTSALRNLRKQLGYTSINLFGLALGLAVSLMIFMFVKHELSYDRQHPQSDNLYRLVLDASLNGRALEAPVAPAPMGEAIVRDYPEAVATARVFGFGGERLLSRGEASFLDSQVFFADSTIFDLLHFEFLRGDPQTALTRPGTIVLTESFAKKLFGDEDALGETIISGDSTRLEVDAVVADSPSNSHLQFSALGTLLDSEQSKADQWISNNFVNYIRLEEGTNPEDLVAKFPEMFETYAGPQLSQAFGMSYQEFLESGNNFGYYLQPVHDIHLKSNFEIDLVTPGSMNYVIMFSAVALFILLLACINFMNLATARGATRAREVAIRKTVGSARSQLIAQFLSEAAVLTFLAMFGALILLWFTLPLFNQMTTQSLAISSLFTPGFIAILVSGAIIVSLIAGLYPAFYLSSFKPVDVLKSETLAGSTKSLLRNGLVIFQFAISISLLIGTFVVKDQLGFIQNTRLGFDREHVVVIERAGTLSEQGQAFKDRLKAHSNILAVGGSTSLPGDIHGGSPYAPEGKGMDEGLIFAPVYIDYEYVEAMGITIAAGRDFSMDFPSDSNAVLINETALSKLGMEFTEGLTLGAFGNGENEDGSPIVERPEVVGVISDYHYLSLRSEIGGLVLHFASFTPNNLVIRLTGNNFQETIDFIETTWAEFEPGSPIALSYLDDNYAELFDADERLGRLFTGFSVFAIIIASLGLFGLGFFITEQRTKEIGIRKTMGASVGQIVVLLSKDFTKLVLIALVVAIPVGYFGMAKWLEGFVYKTDISIMAFAMSGILALAIAWITVSFQSIRAASMNPVKALRRG